MNFRIFIKIRMTNSKDYKFEDALEEAGARKHLLEQWYVNTARKARGDLIAGEASTRDLYSSQQRLIRFLNTLLHKTSPGELEGKIEDSDLQKLISAAQGDWGDIETFARMDEIYEALLGTREEEHAHIKQIKEEYKV